MTTQLSIRIDSKTKEKLSKLARTEGKKTNQMAQEIIAGYLRERDLPAYIDDLWRRAGRKIKNYGIRPGDIESAIEAARAKKK